MYYICIQQHWESWDDLRWTFVFKMAILGLLYRLNKCLPYHLKEVEFLADALLCFSTARPCAPDQASTTTEACYAMPGRKGRSVGTLETTTGRWWRGCRRRQTWSSPSAWPSTTPEPWTAAPTWASGTPWKVSQEAPLQPLCDEPFTPLTRNWICRVRGSTDWFRKQSANGNARRCPRLHERIDVFCAGFGKWPHIPSPPCFCGQVRQAEDKWTTFKTMVEFSTT